MSEADELKAQIAEITKQMEQFQASVGPLKQQHDELKAKEGAAYQAYLEQVGELRLQREKIDTLMFEAQSSVNKIAQQAKIAEARLNEIKMKEQAEAERLEQETQFKVLREKWDIMTAGAPWREWAKDHQIQGGHKITEDRNVILADPMGLGKTLTAIITCDMAQAATKEASPEHPFLGESKEVRVYNNETHQYDYVNKIVGGVERPVGRKVLYFCPAPMIKNVESEFRMWAKHRNVVWIGGMSKAERGFWLEHIAPNQPEFVVICNYEAWRKDLSLVESLINLRFDTIIIDEAHNIKDMKTSAYKGIRKILDEAKPEYVIPMTGTPILNRPQELFSLLTLVNPNKFYHENSFLWDYCEQNEDGKWKFKPGGLDRIAKSISKNFMRRTRDQAGIQLPEKTITIHSIPVDEALYPNQAKVRKQMRDHAMILLSEDKAIPAAAMIAVFTRLRQIETWPAGIELRDKITKEVKLKVDVEESQKIDYLIKWDNDEKEWNGLIPEAIEDERCVLFSQFKAPLRELKDRVERMGKRAVVLDGDTPADIKEQIRIDFDARYTPDRDKSKWDIVLCNYKVGGVGMNLTAASQMFILDEEWNPGKRDQAYDRLHRIGQEKPVTIHVLRDEKTIDDWLAAIMESKEDLVEGFNNTMVNTSDFKEALDSGLI